MICKLSWQAQHFGDFRLYFAQHLRRWRCEFSANRIVRAASRGENGHISWNVLHFYTSDENGNVMSEVSPKSVSHECFPKSVTPRVSSKSVFPRVSFQECRAKCLPRGSPRSVFPRESFQECHAKSVFPRVSCPTDSNSALLIAHAL